MQSHAGNGGEIIAVFEQMDAIWHQVRSVLQEGLQCKMILKVGLIGQCGQWGIGFIFNLLKKSRMLTFLILSHAEQSLLRHSSKQHRNAFLVSINDLPRVRQDWIDGLMLIVLLWISLEEYWLAQCFHTAHAILIVLRSLHHASPQNIQPYISYNHHCLAQLRCLLHLILLMIGFLYAIWVEQNRLARYAWQCLPMYTFESTLMHLRKGLFLRQSKRELAELS